MVAYAYVDMCFFFFAYMSGVCVVGVYTGVVANGDVGVSVVINVYVDMNVHVYMYGYGMYMRMGTQMWLRV